MISNIYQSLIVVFINISLSLTKLSFYNFLDYQILIFIHTSLKYNINFKLKNQEIHS